MIRDSLVTAHLFQQSLGNLSGTVQNAFGNDSVTLSAAAVAGGLDAVPHSMLPMGKGTYEAFVGPTWMLSKGVGLGTVERTENCVRVHTDYGDASVTADPSVPGQVQVEAAGQHFTARITNTENGFSCVDPEGRTVTFKQEKKYIGISVKGFGAYDHFGVYLRKKNV